MLGCLNSNKLSIYEVTLTWGKCLGGVPILNRHIFLTIHVIQINFFH